MAMDRVELERGGKDLAANRAMRHQFDIMALGNLADADHLGNAADATPGEDESGQVGQGINLFGRNQGFDEWQVYGFDFFQQRRCHGPMDAYMVIKAYIKVAANGRPKLK